MSQTEATSKGSGKVGAIFSFPNPVNEVSARLVAAGVVVMCVLTIALNLKWATAVIAYGFVARVLTGPSLSPLGQLMTRVVTPRLPAARPVAGPPKRFAQGIGVAFSVAALVLTILGFWGAAQIVLGLHSRFPRVRLRPVPRMQGLRRAHAVRRGARRGLREVQQHLGGLRHRLIRLGQDDAPHMAATLRW